LQPQQPGPVAPAPAAQAAAAAARAAEADADAQADNARAIAEAEAMLNGGHAEAVDRRYRMQPLMPAADFAAGMDWEALEDIDRAWPDRSARLRARNPVGSSPSLGTGAARDAAGAGALPSSRGRSRRCESLCLGYVHVS
jgi:hypothetical protein